MSCPHLAAAGEAVVGTQPYVWRPVEAVSDDLADVWRLLKKPSWALSPMSGGQWRPSAMSCPHLAAAGEAVVGTQPYVWRPVEAVSDDLADVWRLLKKPSWALSPMSGGQWRPSAMSCPHLAAAGEAVVGTQPYVWRPVEAVSDDLADVWRLLEKPSWALSPMSGGCWRSRRGHSALCLAASGGRQP